MDTLIVVTTFVGCPVLLADVRIATNEEITAIPSRVRAPDRELSVSISHVKLIGHFEPYDLSNVKIKEEYLKELSKKYPIYVCTRGVCGGNGNYQAGATLLDSLEYPRSGHINWLTSSKSKESRVANLYSVPFLALEKCLWVFGDPDPIEDIGDSKSCFQKAVSDFEHSLTDYVPYLDVIPPPDRVLITTKVRQFCRPTLVYGNLLDSSTLRARLEA